MNRADSLSANCFLNSLLRELPSSVRREGHTLLLDLGSSRLRLPLKHWSRLGRHEYQDEFVLESGEKSDLLDFPSLVDAVNAHFEPTSTPDRLMRFRERVLESRENLKASLTEAAKQIHDLYSEPLTFLKAEQGLHVGHNFHPSPKSREGFSAEDLRRYTPEFGATFSISWYGVALELLENKTAVSFERKEWLQQLCAAEGISQPSNLVPFPVHPWQEKVLERDPDFSAYLASGKISRLGESKENWAATSSVRSLYRAGSPYMLKFSLSARLTNSVRHLLPQEVERGGQLFDVLHTRLGQEFREAHPHFHVIGEPAFAFLRRPGGSPLLESVVVCRENPFADHGPDCAVLATLAQDHPFGGMNLIQQMIAKAKGDKSVRAREWFEAYLRVAVRPLFVAQAHYGIAMGAHQQNLILGFQDGLPNRAYFRDCQGTGYSEIGFANFREVASIQRSNGNILSTEMGNYLFAYYLILNSTFNVITAIASSGWITENELIEALRTLLRELRAGNPPDPSCLDYLLKEKNLMHKGNFLCSVQNTNENTIENPLSIYLPVENPLGEL